MRKSTKFAPTISSCQLEERVCLSSSPTLADVQAAVNAAYRSFSTSLTKVEKTTTFKTDAQLNAAVQREVQTLSKNLSNIVTSVPNGASLLPPIQGQLGTSPDFHGKFPSGTLIAQLDSALSVAKVTRSTKTRVTGTAVASQIVDGSRIETLNDIGIAAFAFAGGRFNGNTRSR